MMRKKVVVSILMVVLFVFVVGCLDYKSYEVPEESSDEDLSLVDEIAQIEEELMMEEDMEEEDVEEIPAGEETHEGELSDEQSEEMILEGEQPISPESYEDVQVITVKEAETVQLHVNISDPDEDPITYAFTMPLNEAGTWKTNYGDAGEYLVTLTATDGKLTTSKKIKIVVERVNVPPVITPMKNLTVREGEVIQLEPEVNDPNNDPVTVTISEPLASKAFATDHTSAGEYNIKVTASDGELEAEETFLLTIVDVNVLPEISGVEPRITLKEGEVVEIIPLVTDLDEDEITLTISDPVGDDGRWETSFTDNGEYIVTIVADDSKDKVTAKTTIIVEDVNMPPEIIEIGVETK